MSEYLTAFSTVNDQGESTPAQGLEGAISVASFGSNGQGLRERAIRKLNVLRAKHINRLTYFNVIIACVVFLYTIARTYAKHSIPVQVDGRTLILPSFEPSIVFKLGDIGAIFLQIVIYYTLGPTYLFRVFRNNFDQKMMAFILVANMICPNTLWIAHNLIS